MVRAGPAPLRIVTDHLDTAGAGMQQPEEQDARGIGHRAMEIVTAAVILAFGALFLYTSYRLGFRWGEDGPQSGFFPFYVSLFICIASLVVLVQAIAGRLGKPGALFVEWGQLRQVFSVLIPALVFVLGIQLIGIYVAGAIYIALFMRFIGHYGWAKSVALALGVIVASFLMFEVWFQVPLYKGVWNPLAWTGY